MGNELHNFTLDQFKRAQDGMIAVSDSSFGSYSSFSRLKQDRDSIKDTIENGTIEQKRELSNLYFDQDGFYKRIIIYYATLLKYSGILIPHKNPLNGKGFSNGNLKKYYGALDFLEAMKIPTLLTRITQKMLLDGVYYGVIQEMSRNRFVLIDLPVSYCRTRYKDLEDNNIVEFNLAYFDRMTDKEAQKSALASYPKEISKAYRKYKNGKGSSSWVMLPADIGICFKTSVNQTPLFLSTILAAADYAEAVDTEKTRDKEEIKKILVQKIPHNNENTLLFEPDEALEIHRGTVNMLKHNDKVSVLTTYADVDVVGAKTTSDAVTNNLDKMASNTYREAGVSSQLFCSDNSATLPASIQNDTAMMMNLFAGQYSVFITRLVNKLFGNSDLNFTYNILPITYYNDKEYADSTYKLATAGYSYLLPAIASGFSQKDIVGIKDLENDVLDLGDKLKPLNLSYTQNGEESKGATDEGGAPTKEQSEKKETTLEKEKSLEK